MTYREFEYERVSAELKASKQLVAKLKDERDKAKADAKTIADNMWPILFAVKKLVAYLHYNPGCLTGTREAADLIRQIVALGTGSKLDLTPLPKPGELPS